MGKEAVFFLALFFSVFLHTTAAVSEPKEGLDVDLKDEKIALKTDDDVAEREAESISKQSEYTDEERLIMEANRRQYAYQAEVARVMDIIVRSLYSNKDIFLRELISNASDALDKIRYKSLTDPSALGDVKDLEIKIQSDAEAKTITITDTGIGMTQEELIKNLGTIARSGTKEFSAALAEGTANDLIGQFGVGFYSAFLVADLVTVTSKSNDDPKQHIWESDLNHGFTVTEDPKGNTLGRGTRITLHMKTDSDVLSETTEFLTPEKLKALVSYYSEYINFPIYVYSPTTVEEEVDVDPTDEEEKDVTVDEDKEDDVDVFDDDGKKTITRTVYRWERVNTVKPIWTRSPQDITEEEYFNFYKAITKDHKDPLAYQHFSAEGDVDFKAILYLPAEAPAGQFETGTQKGVKLYVKRVFINDDFDTTLPKYLGFLRGVVDSDSLPLNVSREVLQQSKVLDQIKKKLVRKAIAMFQTLAEDEEKYEGFWKGYSNNVKLGVIEDTQNRARLSKLLRFMSSKTEKNTTFDDYVSRMKDKQNQIYYLAGDNLEVVKNSPLAEALISKGYEVLFMVDPIDEYTLQNLNKYEKYKLTNLGHEGVTLPENEEEEKKDKEEDYDEVFKPLIDYLNKELSDRIGRIKVSDRLVRSPCAILAESWGYTATMERIVKAQALADTSNARAWVGKKVMEINPTHPIIIELNRLVQEDPTPTTARDATALLLESAALSSGYNIEDPSVFVGRIHRILASSLDVALPPAPEAKEPVAKDEL